MFYRISPTGWQWPRALNSTIGPQDLEKDTTRLTDSIPTPKTKEFSFFPRTVKLRLVLPALRNSPSPSHWCLHSTGVKHHNSLPFFFIFTIIQLLFQVFIFIIFIITYIPLIMLLLFFFFFSLSLLYLHPPWMSVMIKNVDRGCTWKKERRQTAEDRRV